MKESHSCDHTSDSNMARMVSTSTGFAMTSSISLYQALDMYCCSTCPVQATIIGWGAFSSLQKVRIYSEHSKPFITGMLMSVRMSAYVCSPFSYDSLTFSRACQPWQARSIMLRRPFISSWLRIICIPRMLKGSSSIIRMRCLFGTFLIRGGFSRIFFFSLGGYSNSSSLSETFIF